MTEAEAATRCGFVALIGAPNTGKSTLLNRLVNARVSLVSRKAQATRAVVRGIIVTGATQIVFVDTPGIFTPGTRQLDKAMVRTAWREMGKADSVVVLVDAHRPKAADSLRIIEGLAGHGDKVFLAINKIDGVEKSQLLAQAEAYNKHYEFGETFMISARFGDGVAALEASVAAGMPEGPWLYPPDSLTDQRPQMRAAEITREQLYHMVHHELPYEATVETSGWEEKPDGSLKVTQIIYVRRDSQKGIIVGQKGVMIRRIGEAARRVMEDYFERRVHLLTTVKMRRDWDKRPDYYRDMGLG
ncbi:MAG: GTPase Era [Parvularculales bacterium]